MIHDSDVVKDIIQEVFISYYKATLHTNSIREPKSWLMRATINKCIDHAKREKRFVKIEDIRRHLSEENLSEKNFEADFLQMALSKLSQREKTLAILYGEGMSYKEIAEISGVGFSSVGKMLARSIEKLDKIVKNMGYEMY